MNGRNNVIELHDAKNIKISGRKNNGCRTLSVLELFLTLRQLENKFRPPINCQSHQLPIAVRELKNKQSGLCCTFRKILCRLEKKKISRLFGAIRALHQSPELEMKCLAFMFRFDCDSQENFAKHHSKRVQNALTNASRVVIEN